MSGAGRLRDLFLLDPDVIFLNHGSFRACPRPVFEVYQSSQRELGRQPVEFLHTGRRFKTLMHEAREALAAYVGADPDDLRKIEVPIMTWNDRRLLRISVQGYNTREDIDALTSALAGLLAEPSHPG